MNILEKVTKETWVLCHNLIDVFHVFKLEVNSSVETGQPELEQFDTEVELEQRINEINPSWIIEYKKRKENK